MVKHCYSINFCFIFIFSDCLSAYKIPFPFLVWRLFKASRHFLLLFSIALPFFLDHGDLNLVQCSKCGKQTSSSKANILQELNTLIIFVAEPKI